MREAAADARIHISGVVRYAVLVDTGGRCRATTISRFVTVPDQAAVAARLLLVPQTVKELLYMNSVGVRWWRWGGTAPPFAPASAGVR